MNTPSPPPTRTETEADDPALAQEVADLVDRLRRGEPIELDRLEASRAEEVRRLLPTIRMMSELASPDVSDAELGSLGDFRILREVARGGMGVVYEATQITLGRRVALKVLRNAPLLDSRHVQRFQVEAQAAASLHHPHIVPVFAVGSERGIPFYAMQFIEGCDLARVLQDWSREPAATPSRTRDRARTVAELGRQAAEALAFAHESQVLHRDIKPSNLLVNAAGHLWMTDFGLARIQGELDLTRTGEQIGTPRYMSPEQASGRHAPLDARTDIYSLGVTLYELATLRPAFSVTSRIGLLRQIAEDEPPAPRRLDANLPRDLETIILKAMAKDPADRYTTARGMAEDLRRYLGDRPILARRSTPVQRAVKWGRRHRALVAVASALLVLSSVAILAATWRHTQELKAEVARANLAVLRATQAEARAEAALNEAQDHRRLAERHLHGALLRQAREVLDQRQVDHALDILESTRSGSDGTDLRDFAWRYLHRRGRRELVRLPESESSPVHGLSLSRDGKTLAAQHKPSPIVLWDIHSETTRLTIEGEPGRELWFPRLSADGRTLVAMDAPSTGRDGPRKLAIWDTATGRLRASLPFGASIASNAVHGLEFLAGEAMLAYVGSDEMGRTAVRVWALHSDPRAGQGPLSLDGLDAAAVAPVGPALAVVERGRLTLRDPRTGEILREIGRDLAGVHALAISPDGRVVAAGGSGRGVCLWSTADGRAIAVADIAGTFRSLAFGPSGETLAVVDGDGLVHLWNRSTGRTHRLSPDDLDRRRDQVIVRFSPDETRVATASHGTPGGFQPIRIWDVPTGRRLGSLPCRAQNATGFVFTPDSRSLVVDLERAPRIWHFDPPPEDPSPIGHSDETWALAYSVDGRLLASGSDDSTADATIKVWDVASGQLRKAWRADPGMVAALAYSPDGRTLASASFDPSENLRLWDADTGGLRATLCGHAGRVRALAFSPDGTRLASGGSDGTIRLWDGQTGQPLSTFRGHEDAVRGLAFLCDGLRIASVSTDRSVRLWDAATGRQETVWRSAEKLTSIAISADESLLAAADETGDISLWTATTGEQRPPIRGDGAELLALAFAPSGHDLAGAGASRVVRVWDAATGQELLSLQGHTARINALAFSPDGSTLASCSHDGAVRLWRAGAVGSP